MIDFVLGGVRCGEHFGFAAAGWHGQEAGRRVCCREDDRVVVSPGRPARIRGGHPTQLDGGSAVHRYLLERRAVEEPNPLPVRRKERHACAVHAGQ